MGLKPLPSSDPANQQRVVQGATLLAGVSLVLVIVNIVLASINQSAQAEANQRQQMLAQAAQLNAVNNLLERELIQQAQGGDTKIQDLLKKANVSFTPPGKS